MKIIFFPKTNCLLTCDQLLQKMAWLNTSSDIKYLFKYLLANIIFRDYFNYHSFEIISNDVNLYAEIPVLKGCAPPPVLVVGFNHS